MSKLSDFVEDIAKNDPLIMAYRMQPKRPSETEILCNDLYRMMQDDKNPCTAYKSTLIKAILFLEGKL